MTVGIYFSCEGHRDGMACRGALNTRTTYVNAAYRESGRTGWRHTDGVLLCPSLNHDEEAKR